MKLAIHILVIVFTIFSTHLNFENSSCANFSNSKKEVCEMNCCTKSKKKSCCEVNNCHFTISYISENTYSIEDKNFKKEIKKINTNINEHLYEVYIKDLKPPKTTTPILL